MQRRRPQHPERHAQRVREQLLRINDDVTGTGCCAALSRRRRPGRCVCRIPSILAAIAADVAEIVALALAHSVVRDRFTGTAVLTRQQAVDLGTLGYVARASGLAVDARHDHPVPGVDYPAPPPVQADGDVLARFLIRAEEIGAFGGHDHRPAAHWSTSCPSTVPVPRPRAVRSSGVGIVEGWRGTIVHRVELDADGVLTRVKIVDPSFFNWPALPVALADTIVPDFPLANKSFNLSYAGNDL